jgi:hypothetical protein
MSHKVYRNKKFLEFTRSRRPIIGWCDEKLRHAHHVKMLNGGGTGIKPPDTHVVCTTWSLHHIIHQHGEKPAFMGSGLEKEDITAAVLNNIINYLDKTHNIDGTKLAIDLLTEYMKSNNL